MIFLCHCRRYATVFEILIIILLIGFIPNESHAFRGMYYEIERPRHSMILSYEYEHDKKTGTSREIDNTTQEFQEKLQIETGGWLVYPRFIIFDLQITPEWEQRREEIEDGETDKSRNSLLGYYANVTLLPTKPYTFHFFADRTRSTVSTTFAAKGNLETDTYGAGVSLKYNILPTQINYRHQENTQTGFFDSSSEKDEVNLVMNYDRHLGESQLNAEYSDETTSIFDTTRRNKNHHITILNNYNFNADVRLVSRYSYNDIESEDDRTTIHRANESLNWEHGNNLRTHYSFRYDNNKLNDSRRESTGLGFDLSARPMQDLTANLNAIGSFNRSPGVREEIYGAGIGLNYTRDIPRGILNVASRHNYSINNRDVTSEFSEVRDESVTLTSGPGTELSQINVVPESIVVTDVTGTVLYKKDVHYRVRVVGATTIISRIAIVIDPVPPIGDGDTVLVDYLFQNNDTFDFSIFNQAYNIDLYFWSIWKLYYEYERSTQRVISGVPSGELSDDIIQTVGTELNWKWSRTWIEYQDRDISELPSDILKVQETITLRPYSNVFFNITGNFALTEFKDTGETQRFYNLNSSLQWFPIRNINITFDGFYNNQTGDVVKTADTGFSSLLRYTLGIWEMRVEYRFDHAKDRVTQEKVRNNMVKFELTRNLF